MRMRDQLFQAVFRNLFVYTILWEDSEVDETVLDASEDDAALAITGAGCSVAGLLSRRLRRVDAVDINSHHLALTALKIEAARRIKSYQTFYDLFGRGWSPTSDITIGNLASNLPSWMQRYWRLHHRRFRRSLHHQGLTAKMLGAFRASTGVDASFIQRMLNASVEERHQQVDTLLVPIVRKPHIRAVMSSPLQLLALGINTRQRDRLITPEEPDLVQFFVEHIKRVAATDLETNWFAWYTTAGTFNHDHPDAVPPYLRRDRHARSLDAPTDVAYHHRNLFHVMADAKPKTWSRYMLCDAPDWMPPKVQQKLFDEILRTSRDGARVLLRSVEPDDVIEHHGLTRNFVLRREESERATRLDRSRQYKRVAVYEVAH